MTRGPKPGSLRKGSLAAKLSNLRPGEWLCLQDQEPEDTTPTLMERNVQTVLFRSPALEGYRISTERVLIIRQGMKVDRATLITREPQD